MGINSFVFVNEKTKMGSIRNKSSSTLVLEDTQCFNSIPEPSSEI